MSSSTLTEPKLRPIAMEIKIQKEKEVDAKKFLRASRFYWTNVGFPKELDRSNHEYTKSPLKSFHTLPPSGPLVF